MENAQANLGVGSTSCMVGRSASSASASGVPNLNSSIPSARTWPALRCDRKRAERYHVDHLAHQSISKDFTSPLCIGFGMRCSHHWR